MLIGLICIGAVGVVRAQGSHEWSASGGYGHLAPDDGGGRASAWTGGSYGIRAGRGYLRFDYEFLRQNLPPLSARSLRPGERQTLHLIGGGWLVGWRLRGIQPFMQVGGAYASFTPDEGERADLFGPALAGGATIGGAIGWFIRPEVRYRLMSYLDSVGELNVDPGAITSVQAGMTVGYRF